MLSNHGKATVEADDLIAAALQIENGVDAESAPPAAAPLSEPAEPVAAAPAEAAPVSGTAEVTAETPLTSPALFNIASDEVKQNIAVLHQQLEELRKSQPPVVQYDFMRAAHTLAGVSRTMGFAAVVELAYALEGWLQARLEKPFSLSSEQSRMLEESIVALDGMIQSICDQDMPQMRSELVNLLLSDRDSLGVTSLAEASDAEQAFAMEFPAAPETLEEAVIPEFSGTEVEQQLFSDLAIPEFDTGQVREESASETSDRIVRGYVRVRTPAGCHGPGSRAGTGACGGTEQACRSSGEAGSCGRKRIAAGRADDSQAERSL